jgi:hypothetical protein
MAKRRGNLAGQVPPPVSPSQDASRPPPPSATYERLRHTIAERMRMSHIDQPLMLMELPGHDVAWQQAAQRLRRTWPGGSWDVHGRQDVQLIFRTGHG